MDENESIIRVFVNYSWRDESFIQKYDLAFEFDHPLSEFDSFLDAAKEKCSERSEIYGHISDYNKSIWHFDVYKAHSNSIWIKMLPSPDSFTMASFLVSYAPEYAIDDVSPMRMYMLESIEFHDYWHDRTMAKWKDVIDIACMFHSSRNEFYKYINAQDETAKITQKYILYGIKPDSIEWNELDMELYEYCFIFAKLFQLNPVYIIIDTIARHLSHLWFWNSLCQQLDEPSIERIMHHLEFILANNDATYSFLFFESGNL